MDYLQQMNPWFHFSLVNALKYTTMITLYIYRDKKAPAVAESCGPACRTTMMSRVDRQR